MRIVSIILIGLVLIICAAGLYAILTRQAITLPTYTYRLDPNSALTTLAHQQNISQFDVKARTDGRVYLKADGRDLGYVEYTPETLGNAVAYGSVVGLPDNALTAMRILPMIFPGLTLNAWLSGLALFHVLPVELNVQLIPG
jgi:hypothetical protein